jgi:peptidyl-prolyl cis-trans isomerase D
MALNPGQTSGLVKSAFGYHIIQTEQKQLAG